MAASSLRAVGAGHQRGEVVGGEERRRRGRAPVVEAARRPPTPRESRAGRRRCSRCRSSTRRSCRPGPSGTRRSSSRRWCRPRPHTCRLGSFSSIAVAPRPISSTSSTCHERVVQEADRRRLDQDVVVVGRAAHERGEPGTRSLTLKPSPSVKNRWAGLLVGGAEHHVAELARTHRLLAQRCRRALVEPLGAARACCMRWPGRGFLARSARRSRRRRVTSVPGSTRATPTVSSCVRTARSSRSSCAAIAAEVVGVVGADPQLHQSAARRLDEAQLLAAVDGGETVLAAASASCSPA